MRHENALPAIAATPATLQTEWPRVNVHCSEKTRTAESRRVADPRPCAPCAPRPAAAKALPGQPLTAPRPLLQLRFGVLANLTRAT